LSEKSTKTEADSLSKPKTDQFDKNESVSSEKNKDPLVVDNIVHAEGNG